MSKRIVITIHDLTLTARLEDNETAQAIWDALPFEGSANRWGDEIYFTIPVELQEASDARQVMSLGELGYWPVGSAFCIFFGPTPVSHADEPRAYSNVNPFGQIDSDITNLRKVKSGEMVSVRRQVA
jgi:hypothetical protein